VPIFRLGIDVSALCSLIPACTRLNLEFFDAPKLQKTEKLYSLLQAVAGYYRILQAYSSLLGQEGVSCGIAIWRQSPIKNRKSKIKNTFIAFFATK
jgi:hypothetical protein